MSTDASSADVPKEEVPSINTNADADAIADASHARRASTSRRSRRKKDDESTPKPKKEKNKEHKDKSNDNDKEKDKDKDKAARAPRRPREKSNATPSSRKKPKLEESTSEAPPGPGSGPTQQHHHDPQLSKLNTSGPEPSKPAPASTYPQSLHPPQTTPNSNSHAAQPYSSRPHSQPPPQPAQTAPQRTSGQNYDPIRSAFDNPSPAPAYSPHAASPQPNYRASASPAISSIIEPPPPHQQRTYAPLPRSSSGNVSTVSSPAPPAMASTPNRPPLISSPGPASSPARGASYAPQQLPPSHDQAQHPGPSHLLPQSQLPKLELSPSASKQPAPQQETQTKPQAQPQVRPQPPQQNERPGQIVPSTEAGKSVSDAMEIDSKEQPGANAKKEKGSGTAPSSKAPSPKPARAAKEAPPLPQGSGLITNALFGGVDDSKSSDGPSTPNIIVHIPLQKGNQIVNFAQLAEEQYGFAALHPRLAAHKERLARVAAAGAALERNDKGKGVSAGESADEDLSLDMERDSDVEGDITMGGVGTESNDAPSQPNQGKRKRRKKVEEYDRDDPFVDDSEMAWQEQAAASKDGFFVYSGPLVPEGEKVAVERADGTIKRGRGRGRGAGRGRSVASQPHVPIAAAVPISQDTGLPLRGPGSRGGTSRRARGTKKAVEGDKGTPERNGSTTSAAQEGRGGRGGGGSNRGGSHAGSRGGKSAPAGASMMSMIDLASTPSSKSPNPPSNTNHDLAPAPGTSPLGKAELTTK